MFCDVIEMQKFFTSAAAAAVLAVLTAGCSSDSSSDDNLLPGLAAVEVFAPQGKTIYLRGEMNDYAALSSYQLIKRSDGAYCTAAPLRADWSPYRFKFADADWSEGSNFGYAAPPGILRDGSAPQELNPSSRFEELRYYPRQDGIYSFCILQQSDRYFVTVAKAEQREQTLIEAIFRRRSAENAQ